MFLLDIFKLLSHTILIQAIMNFAKQILETEALSVYQIAET